MAAFFSHNARQLAFARKLAARPPCQRQQDRARDFKPNDHGKQEAYGGSQKQATSRMGDFHREKVGALDRGGQGGVAEGVTDRCRRDFQPGSLRRRRGHVNEAKGIRIRVVPGIKKNSEPHGWGSALTHHPHVHGIVPGGASLCAGHRRTRKLADARAFRLYRKARRGRLHRRFQKRLRLSRPVRGPHREDRRPGAGAAEQPHE